MKNKNILVTGGLGILGSSLIKNLIKYKTYNIYVLDRSKNLSKIKILELNKIKKLKIIKGNFNDYKTIYRLIKKKKNRSYFSSRRNYSSH